MSFAALTVPLQPTRSYASALAQAPVTPAPAAPAHAQRVRPTLTTPCQPHTPSPRNLRLRAFCFYRHGFSVTHAKKYEQSMLNRTFQAALPNKSENRKYGGPLWTQLDILDTVPPPRVAEFFPDAGDAKRFLVIRGQWYYALFKGIKRPSKENPEGRDWTHFIIKHYLEVQDETTSPISIKIVPGVFQVFRNQNGYWCAQSLAAMSLYRHVHYADKDSELFGMAFLGVLGSIDREIDHRVKNRPKLSENLRNTLRRAYNICKHIRHWDKRRIFSLMYQSFTFLAYVLRKAKVPDDLFGALMRQCRVTSCSITQLEYPDILIPKWLSDDFDLDRQIEFQRFAAEHDDIDCILHLQTAVTESDAVILRKIMEAKFRRSADAFKDAVGAGHAVCKCCGHSTQPEAHAEPEPRSKKRRAVEISSSHGPGTA